MPKKPTGRTALAAEVCFEANTNEISAWNVLCNFLDVAKSEAFRCRELRQALSENSLCIRASRIIRASCIRGNARTRAFTFHPFPRPHARTRNSIHQGRIFACFWITFRTQERSVAERIHGSSHSRCRRFRFTSRIHPQQSGQTATSSKRVGI